MKTKSFDEILNWNYFEKQFAAACMLLDIEEKTRQIETLNNITGEI